MPVLLPAAPVPPVNAATPTDALVVEKFNNEQLTWSAHRRLTWEDFKGQPDEENKHHALTAANLAVNAKCKDNQYTYIVNCVFLPEQSWTKNKHSEKLLIHEQLHFDLTEVHARQLRRDLQQLDCKRIKTDLNAVVANAFKNWKAEQDHFDQASRHGVDKQEQQVWAAGIAKRLQQLESYQ